MFFNFRNIICSSTVLIRDYFRNFSSVRSLISNESSGMSSARFGNFWSLFYLLVVESTVFHFLSDEISKFQLRNISFRDWNASVSSFGFFHVPSFIPKFFVSFFVKIIPKASNPGTLLCSVVCTTHRVFSTFIYVPFKGWIVAVAFFVVFFITTIVFWPKPPNMKW